MPKVQPATSLALPAEVIERRIYLIRGQRVMLDADLAGLYVVPTKALNQAVQRHLDRFPKDFMFRLTSKESKFLNQSQFVTGSQKHRDPRNAPYAFSEICLSMLSSVLNSKQAVQMNIRIMRAFVKLREIMATNNDIATRMEKLEATQRQHTSVITIVVDEIKKLQAAPPLPPKRRIGFKTDL